MVTPRQHYATSLPIRTCPRLPALSLCPYHHPELQHGYHRGGLAVKRLPDPDVCSRGWGHCTGRLPWVCGQGRHGERGRWGWLYFGIGLFLFFFLSFLWFYGLLTGSRLSSCYERRSLADLLQRFLSGAPGGKGSPAGLLCWTG